MKKIILPLFFLLLVSGCSVSDSSGPPYASAVSTGSKLLQEGPSSSAKILVDAQFVLLGERLASNSLAPLVGKDIDLTLKGPVSDSASLLELDVALGDTRSSALFYSGDKNAVRVDGRWYSQASPFFRSPLTDRAIVSKKSWRKIFEGLGEIPVSYSGEEETEAGKAWVYTTRPWRKEISLGESRVGVILAEMIEAGASVDVGYQAPTALPVLLRVRTDFPAAKLAPLLGLKDVKDLPGVSSMQGSLEIQVYGWGQPLPLPPAKLFSRSEGDRVLGWEFLPLWTEGQ